MGRWLTEDVTIAHIYRVPLIRETTLVQVWSRDFILEWDGMSGMEAVFDSLIFFDCLILLLSSTNLGSHRQTMPV